MANLSNINNKFLVTTTGEVLIGQTSNNGNRLQITGADGASYIYLKTDVATTGGRIGFNGDALRVFNQQASGELNLGTAGTTRLTIDSSGRIGIGIIPEAWTLFTPIQTGQASGFIGRTSLNQTDVSTNWYYNGAQLRINTGFAQRYTQHSNGDHTWMSAPTGAADSTITWTEYMRIDQSTGNIGIGTASPSAKLEIAGTTEQRYLQVDAIAGFAGISSGMGAMVEFFNSGDGNNVKIKTNNSTRIDAAPFSVWTDANSRFIIRNDGNVGIGTTSPKTSLDIVKDSDIWHLMVGGATKKLLVGGQAASGDVVLQAGAASTVNNAAVTTAYNLTLQRDGGNVGIGTALPGYKLEVQGDAYINGRDFGKAINYASAQGWIAADPTGNQTAFYNGNFTPNGGSTENKVYWDYNYAGQRTLIWRSQNNDAGGNADGGWNKMMDVASNNMGYMSVVYVKKNTSSNNGSFYHGCYGGNTLYLTGTANTNPYFHSFGVTTLPQDVWCISIGFIQANNDSNTANNSVGGVYRLDTGVKIYSSSSTFKMGTDSQIRQQHRTYLYYSTDVNQNLSFSDPGFYALDGSQPSISDLFGAGVPSAGGSSPWTTSGTDIYYNTGKVGIGITNPAFGLVASLNALPGTVNDGVMIGMETTTNAGNAGYRFKSANEYYQVLYNGSSIQWKNYDTAYNTKMILTNDGNLGVNNTDPSAHPSSRNTLVVGTGVNNGTSGSADTGITIFTAPSVFPKIDMATLAFASNTNNYSSSNFEFQYVNRDNNNFADSNPSLVLQKGTNKFIGITEQSNQSFTPKIVLQPNYYSTNITAGDLDQALVTIPLNSGLNNPGVAIYGDSQGNSNPFIGMVSTSSSSQITTKFIRFYHNTTLCGTIQKRYNANEVQYLTTSDYRLKEDLKPFKALDTICKINVYNYKWKDIEGYNVNYGVLAHELQELIPEVVAGEKDEVNKKGEEEYQSVDYSKLVPHLIQSIQELKAEIELLKSK